MCPSAGIHWTKLADIVAFVSPFGLPVCVIAPPLGCVFCEVDQFYSAIAVCCQNSNASLPKEAHRSLSSSKLFVTIARPYQARHRMSREQDFEASELLIDSRLFELRIAIVIVLQDRPKVPHGAHCRLGSSTHNGDSEAELRHYTRSCLDW